MSEVRKDEQGSYHWIVRGEDLRRLWSPVDPSGIIRSCCVTGNKDLHSQLLYNGEPSEVLLLSGNYGALGGSRVDVIPTGERLAFNRHSSNVYEKLMDDADTARTEVRALQTDSKPHLKSDSHPIRGYKHASEERSLTSYAHADTQGESPSDHEELQPLMDSITGKLRKLPLVRNMCETCSHCCMVAKDADMTQKPHNLELPCPHSLSLLHTPEAYNMKVFEDSVVKGLPLKDVHLNSAADLCPPQARLPTEVPELQGLQKVEPIAGLPTVSTSYDGYNDKGNDMEYMLTYRPETVQGEAYTYNTQEVLEIENTFDGEKRNFDVFDNIDTKSLRKVAASVLANKRSNIDATDLLDHLTASKADENSAQITCGSTIALTGKVNDSHDHKRSHWVCPSEFKVAGIQRNQTSLHISSVRENSNQENAYRTYSLSTFSSRSFDGLPLQAEYMKSGWFPSQDMGDDMCYYNEMSLSALMAKYLRLRKDSNCPESILKALKHLICSRLNKERLYLKHRTGSKEEGQGSAYRTDMLNQIINSLDIYAAQGFNADEAMNFQVQGGNDDASVYTYSSISVSSYDSAIESVFLPLDARNIELPVETEALSNVVHIYGILTVLDENQSKVIPGNKATMYCELLGKNLSFYRLRENAPSITDLIENEPLVILHMDSSINCTALRDRKTGESLLRLTGLKFCTRGDTFYDKVRHTGVFTEEDSNDEDDTRILYFKLFSNKEDIIRWHRAITVRQRKRAFISMLQNEHKIMPYPWNLYFLESPNLMEVNLSYLPFNSHMETRIVTSFAKGHVRWLLASHRDMTDGELSSFMNTWKDPIDTLDLSRNLITLHECGEQFIEYIKSAKVRRLILDGNPLCPLAFELLYSLFFTSELKEVSVRECHMDEKLVDALKKINHNMNVQQQFSVDVRDNIDSQQIIRTLETYPFNRLKVITEPSQTLTPEYIMALFMDCMTPNEIRKLGSVIDGQLISAQARNRAKFNLFRLCQQRSLKYTLDKEYGFFEYRPPYLLAYAQNPNRKSNEERFKEGNMLYVTSCDIAVMNNLRWLQLKGCTPKLVKGGKSDTKVFLVRAYTDEATRRWFEVINRTLFGINYVNYLVRHRKVEPSKHILSFCRSPNAPSLVLYDLPYDREMWPILMRCVNSQSCLKVLDFSNKQLTASDLSFPDFLFGGITLDCLDFSFNKISLLEATRNVFNSVLPPLTCRTYNISFNPLGDCEMSAILFMDACIKAEARKICFNNCELGDKFLSHVIAMLSKLKESERESRLEVVELESNKFSTQLLEKFIQLITVQFPSVVSVRLHDSSDSPLLTEDILEKHEISTTERFSISEPAFGHFRRTIYVKKPKRTTKESVANLLSARRGSSQSQGSSPRQE